jgi:hypothetical protein
MAPDACSRLPESVPRHRTRRALLYAGRASEWDEYRVAFGDGDDLRRVVGLKLVTDGSNQ